MIFWLHYRRGSASAGLGAWREQNTVRRNGQNILLATGGAKIALLISLTIILHCKKPFIQYL
jgi:hypothetical protein